jgi:hypothetical protein
MAATARVKRTLYAYAVAGLQKLSSDEKHNQLFLLILLLLLFIRGRLAFSLN